MIDWTKVLTEVLLAVLTIIAVPLGTFIGQALKALKAKLEAEAAAAFPDAFDLLQKFAVSAVQAAEQSGLVETGEAKKAFAIEQVEKWLAQAGIDLDLDQIDAAIEAAVFAEVNKAD